MGDDPEPLTTDSVAQRREHQQILLLMLCVTAIAACTIVAPEPSVEIRMICAGPAQTKAVLARTHPRLK